MLLVTLGLLVWFAFSYWLFVHPARHVDVRALTPVDPEEVDDTQKLINRLDQELSQGE
jgi:hypothetical protein